MNVMTHGKYNRITMIRNEAYRNNMPIEHEKV